MPIRRSCAPSCSSTSRGSTSAAPKSNYARVVINGESWGIYVNVQQINSELTSEWFSTTKGARWKVPGRPNARGGLAYLGDEAAPYRAIYEIKTKDDPKSWSELAPALQSPEPAR